jgi:Sec-independent protein translocase protein TatA
MQMFGIGLPEVLLILFLAVIVIGPDRLPAFAADLARWIRRARAYGAHLTRDFNEVVSELEKEAGASREDWKEIASLVTRNTGGLTREFERVTSQLGVDLDESKQAEPANVVPFEPGAAGEDSTAMKERKAAAEAEPEPSEEPGEEKPWFVPERATRRRRSRE